MNDTPAVKPRVVWLTNHAAPYRLPLWEHLTEDVELTVLLEQSLDPAVHTESRGAEWSPDTGLSFPMIPVPVIRPRLAGRELTVARHSPRNLLHSADTLVVAGWQSPIYWQFVVYAKRARIHVVGFYESTLMSHRFHSGAPALARRAFFRSLDAVVTPGIAATAAVRSLGVPEVKIFTGFNAVDVDRFQREAGEHRTGQESVRGSEGHRFLYVGQLIERKGVRQLVDAFAEARKPNDRLTLIGSGPLERSLRKSVEEHGISQSVIFRGLVPYLDLPAEMASHHTLVLLSEEEVWGLVVNEALASGLQVIVSDRCGVAQSVANMPGVFVAGHTPAGRRDALRNAQNSWRGWIEEPPILQHTPRAFANTFLNAFQASQDNHRPPAGAIPTRRLQLTIVQPYVPQYRVPFFNKLVAALNDQGIDCIVAAPPATGAQAARNDGSSNSAWHQVTRAHSLQLRSVSLQSLGAWPLLHRADIAIVPASGTTLDSHLALIGPGRSRRRVALWGHIDNFVKPGNQLDARIERRMLRSADHVFAYTTAGRDKALNIGIEPTRVASVNNTLDVEALVKYTQNLTRGDDESFRHEHQLGTGTVFGLVGGLDRDKRIDFVSDVLDELFAIEPTTRLVVAGRGSDEGLLKSGVDRGQVVLLGHVGDDIKAKVMHASKALINPGRIGLIAVECLATKVPLITTPFAYHAPERHYLSEGKSLFIGPDSAAGFARYMNQFDAVGSYGEYPTINDMVSTFVAGILNMLRQP